MTTLVFALSAYLIGSLSFAIIVSKMFGLPDPRTFGSNNPGATNVLRTGKKTAAVLTLLGDAIKGYLAVFLAMQLAPVYGLDDVVVAVVMVAVFLGHLFPVFFKFQGGKGVATAFGIMLALNPWLGLAALATWLLMAFGLKISSLAALSASALAPVYGYFLLKPMVLQGAVLVMSLLLIWRHKQNIQNLISGKEGQIGKKG